MSSASCACVRCCRRRNCWTMRPACMGVRIGNPADVTQANIPEICACATQAEARSAAAPNLALSTQPGITTPDARAGPGACSRLRRGRRVRNGCLPPSAGHLEEEVAMSTMQEEQRSPPVSRASRQSPSASRRRGRLWSAPAGARLSGTVPACMPLGQHAACLHPRHQGVASRARRG